jgi:lipoprotein-releasing system ATP-binding protein
LSDQLILQCNNLKKVYRQGPQQLTVLSGINFAVKTAEKVAIIGASGAGKSTLLNMLGGLDSPSEGDVIVAGKNMALLTDKQRGEVRNRYLGFVYQFHHLLAEFTALENVAMPLLIRGDKPADIETLARDMLDKVGMSERLEHKPSELSGGERQRVAIARALVTKPQCVLLDEPTGNLDHHTADAIHELMQSLNEQLATSFIIVTHDMDLASKMDRQLSLIDGQLVEA